MKELTFKEVIANIKEGEVWEIIGFEIKCSPTGVIEIRSKNTKRVFGFENKDRFRLQRKQYTFEEAFKAYEEGKEIESMKFKYKKIEGGDKFYSQNNKMWFNNDGGFEPIEIRNKWYIND